jgi:hypothetical protein
LAAPKNAISYCNPRLDFAGRLLQVDHNSEVKRLDWNDRFVDSDRRQEVPFDFGCTSFYSFKVQAVDI